MIMGPIKEDAIFTIREEAGENKYGKARCLLIGDAGRDKWVDRVLTDDKAAWDAVVGGYGIWATLHWGKAFPTQDGSMSKFSSWADLAQWGNEAVRAEDLPEEEEIEWPKTCPDEIVFLGCYWGDDEVHAVAWVDEQNNLDSPVFWHPNDPDAALLLALRYRKKE